MWSICGAGKLHSFLDATQKSHLHLVSFFLFHLGDIIISCALEKSFLSFFLLHAKGKKGCHMWLFWTPLLRNVQKLPLYPRVTILSLNNPENTETIFLGEKIGRLGVKNHQIITCYNLNNFTPHMKRNHEKIDWSYLLAI